MRLTRYASPETLTWRSSVHHSFVWNRPEHSARLYEDHHRPGRHRPRQYRFSGLGDYDQDGYEDLFVTHVSPSGTPEKSVLYHNEGNGSFSKITNGVMAQINSTSGSTCWADFDNDGALDLLIINAFGQKTFLFRNNGDGFFTKVTSGPLVTDTGDSQSGAWIDYDRDGFLDVFIPNKNRANFLYHGNGDGSFTRVSTGSLITQSLANNGAPWADFNGDGWPDV